VRRGRTITLKIYDPRLTNQIGFLIGVLLLSACCSARTQIIPRQNGLLVLGHSSSESCAFQECQKAAEEYCQARGRGFVMIKHSSKYQGMDRTAAGVLNAAGALTGTTIHTQTGEDYKVTMAFKCR
jgi:hypothetical protein